jgi:lipopolysaccharide/colanic/teichoic acid biosynthesis glycosyltransferase
VGVVLASPVFVGAALAIKVEGLLDRNAGGPVFFSEDRIARGRVIRMLKFRILTTAGLTSLGSGPTHIAHLERAGELTRVGRVLKQWYLDELPQLINIAKGDIGLIGTRPYPVELYLEEMEQGITRKRDMPAGLIGIVQSHKGDSADPDGVELDRYYWELYQHASAVRLLVEDLRIVARSLRVQLEHKGI